MSKCKFCENVKCWYFSKLSGEGKCIGFFKKEAPSKESLRALKEKFSKVKKGN